MVVMNTYRTIFVWSFSWRDSSSTETETTILPSSVNHSISNKFCKPQDKQQGMKVYIHLMQFSFW